jgi:hypothetical protein
LCSFIHAGDFNRFRNATLGLASLLKLRRYREITRRENDCERHHEAAAGTEQLARSAGSA